MRDKIAEVQQRLKELRKEMQTLRRMEQLNQEAIRDAFSDTLIKIKRVMGSVPGAETQVLRHQRVEANTLIQTYMADKERIEKELSDLETSVEELREDVIARRCRVNVSDVEGFALLLSNITKSLADLKSRFPEIHESLKGVMAGEMEIVVKDERFVKEEPLKLEAALKRCKKLTSTLYTLKRLATVQDNRPLHVPSIAMETKDVGDGEKMAILESIRAMVPDHETRVQSLEAADASRERKKKIVTQQESLKFTKSLQTASKSLKPASHSEDDSAGRSEKGDTGAKSDSRDSARVKSPPPEIPAKPARLLSSSELKKSSSGKTESNRPDSAKSDGGSTSAAGAPHVVTMTSQMSDSDDISSSQLANQRSQARMAFFSSLTSPDTASTNTQPEISKPSLSSELSPSTAKATASSSAAVPHSAASSLGSTSSSHGKASSGMYFQAVSPTRSRSAFSSIPLPNKSPLPTSPDASKDKDEGGDGSKPKKVPPPPPPRKSSAKFPYGFVGGSSSSSTVNGGSSGSGKRDGDKSPDGRGKKDTVLTVYKQPSSPTSPSGGITGPLSSTPKPVTPQKPLNKFQKDIAAGIYANMNRPDLQNQRVAPERIITSMASPPPAAVTTNSQDPQYVDDQDLSGKKCVEMVKFHFTYYNGQELK
nr:hypothetical protein BaRGS_030989 [Batillaria attramentaria]